MPSDRDWLDALPSTWGRQQEALAGLLELCERTPAITSLSVGCSIGRGAADSLSDVDAAVGVDAPRGEAGAELVREVERSVVALLPALGSLVDVLREETATGALFVRSLFAQFEDRLQLDLAVVAESEVRRGDAAPDFVPLYWSGAEPGSTKGASAWEVGAEQVHDWAFHGWRTLLDADKYLRRGSLWEAHQRLQQARDVVWRLWATAHAAAYPWHGLSQVLDQDPVVLPPGVEETVSTLEGPDLRRALIATVGVLDHAAGLAAQARHAHLPDSMAAFARRTVGASPDAVGRPG